MQSKTLPSKPEQSINSDQDVLIVGAGPGGLAAALLLAHSGLKVRVVEKASYIGGRTRIVEHDGFKFDNGPTFFHSRKSSRRFFKPSAGMHMRNWALSH